MSLLTFLLQESLFHRLSKHETFSNIRLHPLLLPLFGIAHSRTIGTHRPRRIPEVRHRAAAILDRFLRAGSAGQQGCGTGQ